MRLQKTALLSLLTVTGLALGACSAGGEVKAQETGGEKMDKPAASDTVKLVTYEAFALSDEAKAAFEKESGLKLEITAAGDGAELTNKLVLTKDAPLGDVAFGMDNNTAPAAAQAGVFADSGVSPEFDATYPEVGEGLLPVDHSQVCLNYDIAWYQGKGLQPPASFDDLLKPEYKDQTVVLDPRNSTPGLAFMLATVKQFGNDGWGEYWQKLTANGAKVASGWSEAFAGDFTAGENESGAAAYPIMVSYASSPAWAVNDDLTASTIGNVPATCYEQVEYVGQLKGAANPEGAKKLIEFLTSAAGQSDLVANNYVYPTVKGVELPEALVKFGAPVEGAAVLDAAEVAQNREDWLRTWADAVAAK